MKKEEIQKELEAIEIKAAELRKKLNEPETFKQWKPKEGERYYYIERDGGVEHEENEQGCFDDELIYNFNAYPSEEIAKREALYFRTLRELRAWSDGLDGVWVISRLGVRNIYAPIPCAVTNRKSNVRFATQERAKQAIEHFGDRLDILYK